MNQNLLGATVASTLRAICQSSNKFGYSSGSANDSAAFEFTYEAYETKQTPSARKMWPLDIRESAA